MACAHPVVLGDTTDSDRASRGKHLVVVGQLGAGLGEFLLSAATSQALISQVRERLLQQVIVIEQSVCGVHAVASDRRKDLIDDSRGECFRGR